MSKYKLIALDLDGTLLTHEKQITEYTYKILEKAAALGVEIVPTTGRFYDSMPKNVLELPFVNYVISINGAVIYDVKNKKILKTHPLDRETSLKVIKFLEDYGTAYDMYADNWGYISQKYYDSIENYVDNPFYVQNVRDFRKPVPDLYTYAKENKCEIQKIQYLSKNDDVIQDITSKLRALFPDCAISSTGYNDGEVNHSDATKGNALTFLADYLGFDIEETIAMGDGGNDVNMVQTAGLGIAMGNAKKCVLDVAKYVTDSNAEDGVAKAIEKFVL